jgi:hypothetical protein
MKAPALAAAARGDAVSNCRRKYPASGIINSAAREIPQAGNQ